MRTTQTLDEAHKYLLYVADALQNLASSHSIDKADRAALNEQAEKLFEYSTELEKIKQNIVSKEQSFKKQRVSAELEQNYQLKKKATLRAAENLAVIKRVLKEAEDSGNFTAIDEAKKRLEYYIKQCHIAAQNELLAKREFELGA